MRELNVNEIEEVNGGSMYEIGRFFGRIFAPAGDVDCRLAP